jgi:gliding motility-associated-like protein
MNRSFHLNMLLGVLLLFTLTVINHKSYAQCGTGVPFYEVDLSASPDGSWLSPPHSRNGLCCASRTPDRCTSFRVTLNPGAQAFKVEIASGAVPPGALYYQLSCGTQIPMGRAACIKGEGPHFITFCKPGVDQNTYRITSYTSPQFPSTAEVRPGCTITTDQIGIFVSNGTWTSISPGGEGEYNRYLSCTSGCSNVTFTPDENAPSFIEYRYCGNPMAEGCAFDYTCGTLRLNVRDAIRVNISPTEPTFCQGESVVLYGSASGGDGNYNYSWKHGGATVSSSQNYTVTSPGTYILEVKDGFGARCRPASNSVTVVELPRTTVFAGKDTTYCPTVPIQLNGSITYADGGRWSGGSGTFSPGSGSLSTTYFPSTSEIERGYVTLTLTTTGTQNGCPDMTDEITITLATDMKVEISPPDEIKCFGEEVELSASASGGVVGYNYEWNTGDKSSNISAGAGSYTVTATDSKGCEVTDQITLEEPELLEAQIVAEDVKCYGDNSGTAQVNATGGTKPYTYNWSSGSKSDKAENLSKGEYSVTVTDDNSCKIELTVSVEEPALLTLTVNKTDVKCNGEENGTATAEVSGGMEPYNYLWDTNPSQRKETASNLAPGKYSVTVTDDNGCTAETSLVITEPDILTISASVIGNALCNGDANGSASTSADGGTTPYSFSWSSGATGELAENLSAGNYSVTVTDANNCSAETSIEITEPDVLTISASLIGNALCNGDANGSASTSAEGGTTPYLFSWSSGANGELAENLSAGNYSITVTDANNCSAETSIEITEPDVLTISTSLIGNALCNGDSNGSASTSAEGGTSPYSFAWSSGANGELEENLSAGNYSVTVTDANNCSAETSIEITEPDVLTISASLIGNALCNGDNNGSASTSADGGTTPYSFSWSSGASGELAENLSAGNYSVTVTDANNCSAETSIEITEPDVLSISASLIGNALCNGDANGSASTSAEGGTGPYSFAWSSGATGELAENLAAGNYSVTVTDANNCSAETSIEITEPDVLSISASLIGNPLCNGDANGSASTSAEGGTSPYSFVWSSGATGELAENLSAGNYSITVTDANNCSAETSIEITEPDVFTISTSLIGNALCNGDNNGSASTSADGGTTPYSFSWSSGATGELAENLAAGNYSVTVTDANNCSAETSIEITEPDVLTISASLIGNALCNGDANGSASASAEGGTSPYSFVWSSGFVGELAENLSAGNYSVTVTDANSCTAETSIEITEPVVLTISASLIGNALCNGDANGSASTSADGGTTPYSFSWSSGASGELAENLSAGNYSVTVTDANSCTAETSIEITEPNILTISASVLGNAICNGDANGSASTSAEGGTGPYSFAWSSGATGEQAENLSADNYSVTVTDANNCSAETSIEITEPVVLTISASLIGNALCNGDANGSASTSAEGGTTPYSFSWSSGAAGELAENLSADNYSVTVTDANNCSAETSIEITEPDVLTISASLIGNALCNGDSNGSASTSAEGGTTPYSFSWSSGVSGELAENLSAGNYSVTVTDANNCSAETSIEITEPDVLTISASLIGNPLCNGDANGSASASAEGGTTPYSFSWSSGATEELAENLSAGNYSVTVTDANNCSAETSIEITEPDVLTISASLIGNALCNGDANGSASTSTEGGTSPYSFVWSSGANGELAENLSAGNYSVTVTDANNCSAENSIEITEPDVLTISTSLIGNALCNGDANGSASTSAEGGTIPYSYTWSSGATGELAENLSAGNYSVTVTDANNCSAETSIEITEPDVLTISASVLGNVLCNGDANGSASTTAEGGTTPYSFSWSSEATEELAENLSAGSYSVTVTDANNCSAETSIEITEPDVLTISASLIGNALCNGDANGSASTSAEGGTAPYSFSWSSGASGELAENLSAGNYSVTVIDANNCSAETSIEITEPDVLTISASLIGNALCNGDANGSASTSAEGGTTPYSFSWSSGVSGELAENLSAGNYSVTVTDANNCSAETSIEITEPDVLTISASLIGNALCNGDRNGSASTSAEGGTSPYSFTWSSGANSELAENLSAGNYSVTVTDANNCSAETSIEITEPDVLTISASLIGNVLCNGDTNGSASTSAEGGTSPYNFAWSNGSVGELTENLSAGNYSVTVTDANNCSAENSIEITEPDVLTISASLIGNALCNGDANGSASTSAEGGTSPYSFVWSSGATGELAENLSAGNYSVTVTDANNCSAETSIEITEPDVLTISASLIGNALCNGDANGSASTSAEGGTTPYSFSWSSGVSGELAENLSAGNYSVTVTDANNCSVENSIEITEPPAILISAKVDSEPQCHGDKTGSASVEVSGGVPPYGYNWNTGDKSSSVTDLSAGEYSVTVTDSKQCAVTQTISVESTGALTALISNIEHLPCDGAGKGSATVSVSGGSGSYNYEWNSNPPQFNSTAVNLDEGEYIIKVTDAGGCNETAELKVKISKGEGEISIALIGLTNPACYGENTGKATVQCTGGTGDYEYHWNCDPPQISAEAEGLSPGIYTVTVKDRNGCGESIMEVEIEEPSEIYLNADITNDHCGTNVGSIKLAVSGGTPEYKYTWDTGNETYILQNLTAGNYTITITDRAGCEKSETYTIDNNADFEVTEKIQHVQCNGGDDGSIEIEIVSGSGTFAFNGGKNNSMNGLIAGTYSVLISNGDGCNITKNYVVEEPEILKIKLIPSLYYYQFNVSKTDASDGHITAEIFGGTPPYRLQWSTGDTTAFIANLAIGTYILEIIDNHGCNLTDSLSMTEPTPIFLPNGLSANGDGYNDYFVIRGMEQYQDNTFTVYNRWGVAVYERRSYNNEWDGRSNSGAMLPTGTYFVVLIINGGQMQLSGYVDLRTN